MASNPKLNPLRLSPVFMDSYIPGNFQRATSMAVSCLILYAQDEGFFRTFSCRYVAWVVLDLCDRRSSMTTLYILSSIIILLYKCVVLTGKKEKTGW